MPRRQPSAVAAATGRARPRSSPRVSHLAAAPSIGSLQHKARGQTLAQMALSWVLRQPVVTSALIGASRVSQIEECVRAVDALGFSSEELSAIDAIAR